METVEYYDLTTTTTTTTVSRQDESHQCVTCGEWFTENIDLQIHMFNMDHHGKVFTSEEVVQGRVPSEVPIATNGNLVQPRAKSYHCKQCNNTFKVKALFMAHKVLHSGGDRHRCAECGKSYVYEKNLERHMSVHTGNKLYPCAECGKSFTRKHNLIRHAQSHSCDKPPNRCTWCSQSFVQQSDMDEHMMKHIF